MAAFTQASVYARHESGPDSFTTIITAGSLPDGDAVGGLAGNVAEGEAEGWGDAPARQPSCVQSSTFVGAVPATKYSVVVNGESADGARPEP